MDEIVEISKVFRTGDSIAVVIPRKVVEFLRIDAKDRIVWKVSGDSVVVKKLEV